MIQVRRCSPALTLGIALGLLSPSIAVAQAPAPANQAPAQAPVPAAEGEGQAPDASLSELLLELGRAQQLADEDPQVGAPRLAAALERFHGFPAELAQDEAAQAARLEGLLILARAQMNLGAEAAAAAALDEALRCAHGQALNAARLGPSLAKLEASRRDAIGDMAPLRVSCSVPCRIYVDEREAGPDTELPVGAYRVTVLPRSASGPDPLVTTVQVAAAGAAVELNFGPPAPEVPDGPAAVDRPRSDPAGARVRKAPREGRLLPRWAEISGLVLGVAALGTGVGLLVIDGSCSGGGSAAGPDACDDLYSTAIPGFALVGAGAALTVGGAVLLGIDETRAKRKSVSVAPSGLRLRF